MSVAAAAQPLAGDVRVLCPYCGVTACAEGRWGVKVLPLPEMGHTFCTKQDLGSSFVKWVYSVLTELQSLIKILRRTKGAI